MTGRAATPTMATSATASPKRAIHQAPTVPLTSACLGDRQECNVLHKRFHSSDQECCELWNKADETAWTVGPRPKPEPKRFGETGQRSLAPPLCATKDALSMRFQLSTSAEVSSCFPKATKQRAGASEA